MMRIIEPGTTVNNLTSFNNVYSCTEEDLHNLQNFLNGSTFIGGITGLFKGDQSKFIGNIRVYPFSFSQHDPDGVSTDNIKRLIRMGARSIAGLYATAYIESNYNTVFDVKTFTIQPHFNNFLDYSPYTKIDLFLPYVGFVKLEPEEVMGRELNIKYIVDLSTGGCTAVIEDVEEHAIIKSYPGQIGIEVPLGTYSESIDAMRKVIDTGLSIGAAFVGSTLGKAATYGALTKQREATAIKSAVKALDKFMETRLPEIRSRGLDDEAVDEVIKVSSDAYDSAYDNFDMSKVDNPYLTGNLISNSVQKTIGIFSPTGSVSRGSSGSGWSNLFTPQQPYLIITRPKLKQPENYEKYIGKPLYATKRLNELSGYTVVNNIHCNGIVGATSVEVSTIMDALANGVIL